MNLIMLEGEPREAWDLVPTSHSSSLLLLCKGNHISQNHFLSFPFVRRVDGSSDPTIDAHFPPSSSLNSMHALKNFWSSKQSVGGRSRLGVLKCFGWLEERRGGSRSLMMGFSRWYLGYLSTFLFAQALRCQKLFLQVMPPCLTVTHPHPKLNLAMLFFWHNSELRSMRHLMEMERWDGWRSPRWEWPPRALT